MNTSLLDILWILVASSLVFIMQGGFALLESGLTRSKNSINVAIKNLTDFGISVLAFWLVGFGLMFGPGLMGVVGTGDFFFSSQDIHRGTFFLFQVMFASTAATIVSGAVAERMKFSAYILVTLVISLAIYPVVGHWIWNDGSAGGPAGWLKNLGFVDFAGSTVVHSVGGWVSLAAILIIGPRIGRYDAQGKVNKISGSNLPNAVTGVIILMFGWFGFNGGSTLALNAQVPQVILNTTLAGAAGMIGALALGWPLFRVPDAGLVINGVLGGLVAITAGCHAVSGPESLLIGALGGMMALGAQVLLDKLKIDDAVGAIPVHLFAGIWGTLATGIFGDLTLLGTGLDRGEQILVQLAGIGVTGGWSFLAASLLLGLINYFFPLRVSQEDEIKGLNVAEHDASTEIYDLYRTLEDQAKTGDLSLRIPVEPFTEVGQIASQYNKVMDSLQNSVVARSEYVSILDNVHDGLLLIDREGNLGPFYSKALETILDRKDLAGKNLFDLLGPLVSESRLAPVRDFLDVLFDGSLDFKTVGRLNPLEKLDVFLDRGQGQMESRHLHIRFQRVMEQGVVARAMVIVSDLTAQKDLENAMEAEKKDRSSEMELFYTILHLDPVLLREFVETYDSRVLQVNRLFEAGQGVPKDVLKQAAKRLHGIKGEASLLNLDFIVAAVHKIEDLIDHLVDKDGPGNEDFISLALRLGELTEMGQRMSRVLEKMTEFQTSFIQANMPTGTPSSSETSQGFLPSLVSMARRLGEEAGKKVSLEAQYLEMELFDKNTQGIVRQILVQLVRNSVAHGIEIPEKRRAAKKPGAGLIRIWTERMGNQVVLAYRDDGRGLDVESLRQKAAERGLPDSLISGWSQDEWYRFAFSGDVSTSAVLNETAGRGVGMALVKELSQKVGAKLGVRSVPGQSMEFRLQFKSGESAA